MIKVLIERLEDTREIVFFSVSGHADYDRSGKDIVCAGVSAVTIGTVNAVEALLQVELSAEEKSGLLQVEIPDQLEQNTRMNVQLLLESMIVMLRSIRDSYEKYIAIKENFVGKRR
ncbi:MAG: ribosomal protein [Paenibacillus sp. RIFOXYA1_FULL_44_5]|nr:MAG: ribosomal protein [Paenibacillus sp. RIFOXYA1_FULL_44_5]